MQWCAERRNTAEAHACCARAAVSCRDLVCASHIGERRKHAAVLTPGDVFPNVSVDAICTPGYAGSVRHVTAIVRQQVFTAYGLTGNHTGYCDGPQGCELDHLISLELGGSNDPKNLWPESYDSQPWNAHVKDHLENTLHALVCSGKVPLAEAQQAIASDWIGSYGKYVHARRHD